MLLTRSGLSSPGWSTLLAFVVLSTACVSTAPDRSFDFYVESNPDQQAWYEKIDTWQRESLEDADGLVLESRPVRASADSYLRRGQDAPLAVKVADFAATEQRQVARRINKWSQRQALWHYKKEDVETAAEDEWPTFRKLIDNNGDDCDGLDLISYQLLLRFGFESEGVFRAVMRRETDRTNHMVTLWFETPEDPWVLDATRAIVTEMTKMSQVHGWTPTVMFNQQRQFTVREAQRAARWVND